MCIRDRGDSADLAAKLAAFPSTGTALAKLRRFSRDEFERSYSSEVVSVSYTHLDVYKRQLLCLLNCSDQ